MKKKTQITKVKNERVDIITKFRKVKRIFRNTMNKFMPTNYTTKMKRKI